MSREPNDPVEPVPFREAAADDTLDASLGAAFALLAAKTDLPPAWQELEAAAERIARPRRAAHAARRLLASLPLRYAAAAGAALVIAGAGAFGLHRLGKVTDTETRLGEPGGRQREYTLASGASLVTEGVVRLDQRNPLATRLFLDSGRVSLDVPPLGKGTMRVSTPAAEVIVHGTRFDVDAANDRTAVRVTAGLVEVRPNGGNRPARFVRAGESLEVPSLRRFAGELEGRLRLVEDCSASTTADLQTFTQAGAEAGMDVTEAAYRLGLCALLARDAERAAGWFDLAAASNDRVRADNARARAAMAHALRDPEAGKTAWERYRREFPDGLHRDLAERSLR